MKSLISRRKKSAPEQETNKKILQNINNNNNNSNANFIIDPDEDFADDFSPSTSTGNVMVNSNIKIQTINGTSGYSSVGMNNNAITLNNTLHSYFIYLTESCCVEVSTTQSNSTVQNILLQSLRKIKASEDSNEYCLVEHIEQEQSMSANNPEITNVASNSNSVVNKNKTIIKTRILRPNENLFVLTHVWNQMKQEKKDGFKNVKVI